MVFHLKKRQLLSGEIVICVLNQFLFRLSFHPPHACTLFPAQGSMEGGNSHVCFIRIRLMSSSFHSPVK